MSVATETDRAERSCLVLSGVGNIVIAAVGLTIAVLSKSQAIMLDGMFNLIYFGTALFTLRVAFLVRKGDDARYPYGYGFFEPLVNGLKGVLILGVSWMRSGDAGDGSRSVWPSWVTPTAAIGPAVLGLAFLFLAVRRTRQFGFGPRAADKIYRYGSLWLTLYAVAWMLGAARVREAMLLGVLAVVGFLTMTTLRELYGLAEQPVGYRR